MSRYLAIRGSTHGPLFICANGTPLSPSMVNAWLRSILKGAGVPRNFSDANMKAAIEDLKKIDVWAYGMVLFKICNPHIRYPYYLEKNSRDKLKAMQTLIKEGRRSTSDSKYECLHSNEWKLLLELYNTCTAFKAIERPSIHESVKRFDPDHEDPSSNKR